MNGGLRQSMAWLHTWTGLPVGWVLFFVFLTGTLGYFDSEIDRWMRPEAPLALPAPSQMDGLTMGLARLERVAPRASRWTVFPPSGHDVPNVTIAWSGPGGAAGRRSEALDPRTGAPFEARATGGGQTLYQLHYTLHYLPRPAARWLVGICSMLMLVAIVSGVITHKKFFTDFLAFRPGQGQRSWLDIHNVLSVTALPFHLVLTYSGLVFFVFTYMSPVLDTTYGRDQRDRFFDEAFRNPPIPEPAGVAAPPAPLALASMYETAERHWGEAPLRVVSVYNPGDRNARVVFTRNHVDAVSNGGRMVFDGATGALLERFDRRTGPMAVNDALLALHEGLFAGPVLRWLYFLSGLLGTAMIGTGLVLWTAKRKARAAAGPLPPAIRVVERLNVGTIVGLPIGIAAYFWANRLLPVGMADRAAWEVHVLFLVWLAMLAWPWLRPARRAWTDQLGLAAVAYCALPVLNAATTDQHLAASIPAGAWEVAGFDLVALAAGLGFAAATVYLYRRAPEPAGAGEPAGGSAGDDASALGAPGVPYPEDAAG